MVSAAKHIMETGQYIYSRPPGNPLYEYIISFVASASPWVSNLLSALISSISSIFFALILHHIKIKNYIILSIFFSFVPIIYINSTNTMDYMFALTFALASIYFVLTRHLLLSGVFIGLAIGCRLTYIALILPLTLWILFDKDNQQITKQILYFLSMSIIISLIVFFPVFSTYGLSFFTFSDNIEYPTILSLLIIGVYGVWGLTYLVSFIIMLTIIFWNQTYNKMNFSIKSKKVLYFSISIIFIYTIIFLRLPHESAYLIPIVPFIIISFAILIQSYYIKTIVIIVIIVTFIQLLIGKFIY